MCVSLEYTLLGDTVHLTLQGYRGMSRRSKKSQSGHTSDDLEDDLQSMLAAEQAIPRRVHPVTSPTATRKISDGRRWAPDRVDDFRDPVREATGRPARVVHKVATRKPVSGSRKFQTRVNSTASLWTLSDRPYFRSPTSTSLCEARRKRRESLFALRRTGKGARTPKRRNKWSSISC